MSDLDVILSNSSPTDKTALRDFLKEQNVLAVGDLEALKDFSDAENKHKYFLVIDDARGSLEALIYERDDTQSGSEPDVITGNQGEKYKLRTPDAGLAVDETVNALLDRDQFDGEVKNFKVQVTDENKIYTKLSATSGDWDNGLSLQGPDGPPGQDGADGQDGTDGTDGAPGADGQDGDDLHIDATVNTLAERAAYDAQAAGYKVQVSDEDAIFTKLSATSGDWDNGLSLGGGGGATVNVAQFSVITATEIVSNPLNGSLTNPSQYTVI